MAYDALPVLASTARTATATSAAFRNGRSARGMMLLLNVSAVTATPNLSAIAIQVKVGSTWTTIYSWTGLIIATTGQRTFLLHENNADAASWTAAPIQGPVPYEMKVVVTHDDADSITYQLDAEFLA